MSSYGLMWDLSWRGGVLLILLCFVELVVVGTPVPIEGFYPGFVLAATGIIGPALEHYAETFTAVRNSGEESLGGEGA